MLILQNKQKKLKEKRKNKKNDNKRQIMQLSIQPATIDQVCFICCENGTQILTSANIFPGAQEFQTSRSSNDQNHPNCQLFGPILLNLISSAGPCIHLLFYLTE